MATIYKKGKWATSGRVLPGCRTAPKRIDQLLEDGTVIQIDHDQKLSPTEIKALLRGCFPDGREKDGRVFLSALNATGRCVSFYTRNISHLGGEWGPEKKRIQIGTDFPKLFQQNQANNTETALLGIYHYYPDNKSGVVLFVCFSSVTYSRKHSNNSAAHVHTIDLLNAQKHGVYRRLDKAGNELLVLDRDNFIKHINSLRGAEEVDSVKKDRETLDYLGSMFDSMPRRLVGIDCYKEMMAANDTQRMNQAAWEGWYPEFYIENYLIAHPTSNIVWWSKKGQGKLDFDLRFPYRKWFYGDVKSDAKDKDVQGNVKDNVDILVQQNNGRLWYIAIDFTPDRDANHGYTTTLWWNKRLGKTDKPMSYCKRMKYAITINRMDVYEITTNTIRFLDIYTPSPCAGKDRRPKYKIPSGMKEYLRIYQRA